MIMNFLQQLRPAELISADSERWEGRVEDGNKERAKERAQHVNSKRLACVAVLDLPGAHIGVCPPLF